MSSWMVREELQSLYSFPLSPYLLLLLRTYHIRKEVLRLCPQRDSAPEARGTAVTLVKCALQAYLEYVGQWLSWFVLSFEAQNRGDMLGTALKLAIAPSPHLNLGYPLGW